MRHPVIIALLMMLSFNVLSKDTVLHTVDFSKCGDGDAAPWLESNGFKLRKGFTDPKRVKIYFRDGRLYFDTLDDVLGLAVNDHNVGAAAKVSITWGVDKYPVGASYAKGVNNEAVMLLVYFGDEKLPSGSWFIPDSPYFIGVYPSDNDNIDAVYTGRHFKEGGRFVCVANPSPGEEVTTEYELSANFKKLFKQKKVPPVSGFAIEVDTSYVDLGAKAYIRKIEFIK